MGRYMRKEFDRMKLAELLANPKYGKVIMRKILLIITFTILLIFGLFNTQTLC